MFWDVVCWVIVLCISWKLNHLKFITLSKYNYWLSFLFVALVYQFRKEGFNLSFFV